MVKRLEDTIHDIEVEKNVLDSMPVNNAKNLETFLKKVADLEEEYSGYKKEITNEINRRSSKYLNVKPSPRIELIKKELQDYKDLALFNPVNTPFEKMGFDTLLYSITHYYKTDLANVNADIKEAFRRFELAGITLTENDFVYSNYARKYVKELLKDDDLERMKDVFEDLHWKCPEVISHVETSLRILFNKHINEFNNYINNLQKEIILDNLTYEDYVMKRDNLAKELYELEHYDQAKIIERFLNSELLLNDYSIVNVSKCYSKFLGDNCDVSKGKAKSEDFKNLYYNLEEYKNYLKYSYVLEDVKKKYAERDAHKDDVLGISKEIDVLVNEIEKLTREINEGSSKGLFGLFKKKVDIEKNYLSVNEKVKELDAKYEEYDKALVYNKLAEHITDTSSIYDVFRFVLSFKGYLRMCIKDHEEDADIRFVKETVRDFENFLENPNVTVIKNLAFGVDNDVALIIIDHYKLLEINLDRAEMESRDDIEALQNNLEIIINSNVLESYDLSIDLINSIFDSKKIIDA